MWGNCVEVVIASAAPQSFEGATRETHDTEEEKISETGIWFCLKSKQEGNRCKWVRIVRVKWDHIDKPLRTVPSTQCYLVVMISCSYIICLRLFSKITTKLHKYSLETPSPGTKPRTAVNLLGMPNFSSMSKYKSVHQEELSFKRRPDTYRQT